VQPCLLTLLPLLRTTLAIVFITLFTLSALWTLGVQIAPLLAGAGIFGLAIGFGAQTLVRDDVFANSEHILDQEKHARDHIDKFNIPLPLSVAKAGRAPKALWNIFRSEP